MFGRAVLAAMLCLPAGAQVYSPSVLLQGQPDATDLKKFTQAIYRKAGAKTPQEKAVAIWRFFLTDGRFVEPGFWYHIAGWAYEEPVGEVLDPMKLLNSYGFGLCYHIAPLLEAVFEAGGFSDARVWFLTGHTVAEVYYDGAYHYFDSDMMGYNVVPSGAVASVQDVKRDPNIILKGPRSQPWYPADVQANAIPDLASLFSTTKDNYLFPQTRYSLGHDMSYVLRPGEKLIRYFHPEQPNLYYLPYAFDGKEWREFPQEIARYNIRTADGPHSQKDTRLWGTGRIEYTPPVIGAASEVVFDMPSPWVIIDARFVLKLALSKGDGVRVDTSVDGARWDLAGEVRGPHEGEWTAEPRVIVQSANGRHTVVSGRYGYQVRITRTGAAKIAGAIFTSRVQLNPRTLPALAPGENSLVYESGATLERTNVPVDLRRLDGFKYVEEKGQQLLLPRAGGEAIVEVAAKRLLGFDVGLRALYLRDGLAPDKLTAETRPTAIRTGDGSAAIEWSLSRSGPWKTAASTRNETAPRTLLWPELFAQVRDLPAGTKRVYVRLRSDGPAIDNVRIAAVAAAAAPSGRVKITHAWTENSAPREHVEVIDAPARRHEYRVRAGASVRNESVTFEAIR